MDRKGLCINHNRDHWMKGLCVNHNRDHWMKGLCVNHNKTKVVIIVKKVEMEDHCSKIISCGKRQRNVLPFHVAHNNTPYIIFMRC